MGTITAAAPAATYARSKNRRCAISVIRVIKSKRVPDAVRMNRLGKLSGQSRSPPITPNFRISTRKLEVEVAEIDAIVSSVFADNRYRWGSSPDVAPTGSEG